MNIQGSWFLSALIAMFCYAAMALILKILTKDVNTWVILFYLFSFSTILFGVNSIRFIESYRVDVNSFFLLIIAALMAFLGNFFDLKALQHAPNVGYAAAIKAGQVGLITILACFFIKDQSISVTGVSGLFFMLLGIVLLSLQ